LKFKLQEPNHGNNLVSTLNFWKGDINMAKITGNMLVKDAVYGLAGESRGAQVACMEIFSKAEGIDPDSQIGSMGYLLVLDLLGIYKKRIFILWNDICRRDPGKIIALLCASQMGCISSVCPDSINFAIDNNGQGIDLNLVVESVKKRLPNFNPNYYLNK